MRAAAERHPRWTLSRAGVSDHGGLQGVLRLTTTTPEFLYFGLIAAG